jgi:replicative DNA helicase
MKTPPFDLNAEKALIGSALIRPDVIKDVEELIDVKSFYSLQHQRIWSTLCAMRQEHYPIDMLLLSERLTREETLDEVGGMSYLAELVNIVPSSANAMKYAEVVHRKFIMREIISAAEDISKVAGNEEKGIQEIGEYSERVLTSITRKIVLPNSGMYKDNLDIQAVIAEFREKQKEYKTKFENGGKLIGLPTGYDKIDKIIDGFRPSHLWVIGAYTNMGKTAASLNFAAELIRQGKRVVFYSLEMTRLDILARLVGILTNQSGVSILKGFPHDEAKVQQALDMIVESGMTIHTNKYELSAVEFSMFEEHATKKVDLFILDFIQLVTLKGSRSEYETTTAAILGMQQAAKKLSVPTIILSQISNDGARNSNEVVMAFKGSGGIAAAADLAIEIQIGEENATEWKHKMQEGKPVTMKWNIRKNRHGSVGYVEMEFTGRTGVFSQKVDELDILTKQND